MTKTIHDDKQLELNLGAVSPTETQPVSIDAPDKPQEPAPVLHPPPENAWEDLGYTPRGKRR